MTAFTTSVHTEKVLEALAGRVARKDATMPFSYSLPFMPYIKVIDQDSPGNGDTFDVAYLPRKCVLLFTMVYSTDLSNVASIAWRDTNGAVGPFTVFNGSSLDMAAGVGQTTDDLFLRVTAGALTTDIDLTVLFVLAGEDNYINLDHETTLS